MRISVSRNRQLQMQMQLLGGYSDGCVYAILPAIKGSGRIQNMGASNAIFLYTIEYEYIVRYLSYLLQPFCDMLIQKRVNFIKLERVSC